MKEATKIKVFAYCLTYVGYMTLTISMTLTPHIAESLNIAYYNAQVAMSLSFFMFSLSAVLFATLSDIFTAQKVLIFSQLLSVAGLFILFMSSNIYMMYLGFVFAGLGTGCYSSIARAIISRNTKNKDIMRKAYAILSCCIILAPIMGTYIAILLIPFSWRFAYLSMVIIEMMLLLYSFGVLRIDAKQHILVSPRNIASIYKDILSKPTYTINVAIVAVLFSFYLGVLMSTFKGLLVNDLDVDLHYFSLILLFASIVYIVGIFTYRHRAHRTHKKRYNIGILIVMLFFVIYYTVADVNSYNVIMSLHSICYLLGFFIPLATGVAMIDITNGHGSAAAMITFSVALCMSIWEFVKAHLGLSNYDFILLALWVSFTIVVILRLLLFFFEKRKV